MTLLGESHMSVFQNVGSRYSGIWNSSDNRPPRMKGIMLCQIGLPHVSRIEKSGFSSTQNQRNQRVYCRLHTSDWALSFSAPFHHPSRNNSVDTVQVGEKALPLHPPLCSKKFFTLEIACQDNQSHHGIPIDSFRYHCCRAFVDSDFSVCSLRSVHRETK
jgi:hypothetical protein